MRIKILKATAFVAFVCFCFINLKTVISQKGDVSFDLELSGIDAVNASCETFPDGDNGDCKPSPQGGYCADSWAIHDCKQ